MSALDRAIECVRQNDCDICRRTLLALGTQPPMTVGIDLGGKDASVVFLVDSAGGIEVVDAFTFNTPEVVDTRTSFQKAIGVLPDARLLSDSARRKATPIWSGVMRYFPDAIAAVARVSKAGNDKHNPGQPLHWSRDKSTDHGDCIARHQLTPEEVDPETGELHAAAVAWRALAQLQLLEERRKVQDEAAEKLRGSPATKQVDGYLRSTLLRRRGWL